MHHMASLPAHASHILAIKAIRPWAIYLDRCLYGHSKRCGSWTLSLSGKRTGTPLSCMAALHSRIWRAIFLSVFSHQFGETCPERRVGRVSIA